VRIILIFSIIALSITAYAQTNITLTEFSDVLILKENNGLTAVSAPIPPIRNAVLSSILIVLLACSAYVASFYITKLKAPWWTLGYVIPIILTAIIAVGRWHPTLEMNPFFGILMHERREYIVMALSTALLLAVPASKLKRKLSTVLVASFAALFVIHFSVLPFLLPAFNRNTLLNINTSFDHFVTVLQVTDELVTVADPARGMRIITLEDFETDWRRTGITLTGPNQPCRQF